MNLLKDWLLGVIAAALAVALAQALTPEGAVKKVGRLVGGLVLLLAVVRPLGKLELDGLAVAAANMGSLAGTEERAGEKVMKTLIVEKAGAYIVDKGSALGVDCQASVTVRADETGWLVPWAVEITGDLTAEQERRLSQAVEEELSIPAQRQSFRKEVP